MPDFNSCTIVGRLGKDPELRYTPSNTAVTLFSLAVAERWTDKQSGEKQERTNWIPCEAFARTAEVINQYCRKGSSLLIAGKLRLDTWQDKDGGNRSKLKVVVENFQFIDSKGDDAPRSPQQASTASAGNHGPVGEDDVPF